MTNTLTDTIKKAYPDWDDQQVTEYLSERIEAEGAEKIQALNAELTPESVAQFFQDGQVTDFAQVAFDVPELVQPELPSEPTAFQKIQTAFPDKTTEEIDEELANGTISLSDYQTDKSELEQLIGTLRSYESVKQAQAMIKFIQMAQEGFRLEFGRYFGSGDLFFGLKAKELAGLTVETNNLAHADGTQGYYIKFIFDNGQVRLEKTIGVGEGIGIHDWQLATND